MSSSTSPGLPLLGDASYHLGLGLWRHTGLELAVECGLGGRRLVALLRRPGLGGGARRWGLAAVVAVSALLTIWGALATGPPPAPAAMAVVSLLTIGVLTVLACWLDREAAPAAVGPGAPPHPPDIVTGRSRKVSSSA